MNMKKTIAAIAAGAMAVSAMASSVSAIELKDQVLSYNLVRTHKKNTEGVVTISGSISGVDLSAVGGTLKVKVATPDGMPVKSITVGGYYNGNPATPITNPYTRVNDKNADNYGSTVKDGYVDISVGTGSGWFSATANTTITVTVVYGHTEDNLKAINDNIAKFGIFAGKASDEPVYVAEGFYVDDGSDSDHNGNKKQDWDEPTEYWLANSKSVTTRDDDKKLYLTADTDVATIGTLRKDVVSSAFTAKGSTEYKIPFATYANGNQNIVYYLQNNPVRTADAGYTNVLPVINDAIANYGTVTFTFTTATQGIAYTVQNDKTGEKYFDKIYGGTTGNYGPDGTYAKAVENAGILSTDSNGWDYDAAKQGILAFYTSEWYGDTSYTSFTQHLYNGTNDVYAEQNGWAGFANGENFYGGLWGDNNLFGGALVINENLTMRLSDVDMFD